MIFRDSLFICQKKIRQEVDNKPADQEEDESDVCVFGVHQQVSYKVSARAADTNVMSETIPVCASH